MWSGSLSAFMLIKLTFPIAILDESKIQFNCHLIFDFYFISLWFLSKIQKEKENAFDHHATAFDNVQRKHDDSQRLSLSFGIFRGNSSLSWSRVRPLWLSCYYQSGTSERPAGPYLDHDLIYPNHSYSACSKSMLTNLTKIMVVDYVRWRTNYRWWKNIFRRFSQFLNLFEDEYMYFGFFGALKEFFGHF